MLTDYESFFGMFCPAAPHKWQVDLATSTTASNRLIRIPTGFGKTLGVLSAWSWNRLVQNNETWPRRLVWCLPMRVLVEQTEVEIRRLLQQLGLLWDGIEDHHGKVGVHVLMGGTDAGEWHLYPEECSVLIGTQDMLLSRTLNRGYGAARARWPMEFGLLNQDALWVMDEIQLMDVGLATSAQIQAFRFEDSTKQLRPCHTWWMSATLQEGWLRTIDTASMLEQLPARTEIPAQHHVGALWEVSKPCTLESVSDDKAIVDLALVRHEPGTLTLIVVNTVNAAKNVFSRLSSATTASDIDLRLVHSRFRPAERRTWREEFLNRSAVIPPAGRIIVATQVIEAGVDLSARNLLTDLAPWPSLVQRFGRCARYGGETGRIALLDRGWGEKDAKKALPYDLELILQIKPIIVELGDVSPAFLERFEAGLSPDTRKALYPYKPRQLLLRREWDELFDTSPDLSGADLDISRFIRSGEENDCQVFWRDIPAEGPSEEWKPFREELCAVPFLKARDWLCGGKDSQKVKTRKVEKRSHPVAWVWDWLNGQWNPETKRSHLLPGTLVLVDASFGGYDLDLGWEPESRPAIQSMDLRIGRWSSLQDQTDGSAGREDLSLSQWKTIATHGAEVASVAMEIGNCIGFPEDLKKVFEAAGRWHDIGKSHPNFQASIQLPIRPNRNDLAKAPREAWLRKNLYRNDGDYRPGFRHELASMLALFSTLRLAQPGHVALDPRPGYTWEDGSIVAWEAGGIPMKLDISFMGWDAPQFNLLAYLVLCHHGKVRVSLQASPQDQDYRAAIGDERGLPIRGIRAGDQLPALYGEDGLQMVNEVHLDLELAQLGLSEYTGPSWTDRVIGLREQFGPGTLAYLEAILRAADIRASKLDTPDPLLSGDAS